MLSLPVPCHMNMSSATSTPLRPLRRDHGAGAARESTLAPLRSSFRFLLRARVFAVGTAPEMLGRERPPSDPPTGLGG
jgi:hypothetical protein